MSHGYLYHLWDEGQRHLAAGRYGAARRALDGAEAMAWRDRDAASLARIYLPLLEVRRLLRYHSVEGQIVICDLHPQRGLRQQVRRFAAEMAGTILLAAQRNIDEALHAAEAVRTAAYHTGRPLEALVLLEHGVRTRLASSADARWDAGLQVEWTGDEHRAIGESTDPNLKVPLPSAGTFDGKSRGLGALARESLLIAWEALALRWQGRHPLPPRSDPWDEMAWLRKASHVDGACEPVMMRLMSLAEGLARVGNL